MNARETVAGKGIVTSMANVKIPLLIILILLLWVSVSCARTFVLVTVDVESFHDGNPSKQIWGEVDDSSERFGIEKIMDTLEAADARGTFYLNVYEAAKFGEEPIKKAAREIDRRGHDLELHTHPSPMFRYYVMTRASEKEQREILAKGIELIRQWTGKQVIAHRAGGYAANLDTLRAMKSVGLEIDSSLTIDTPLAQSGYLTNSVTQIEGVIEVPATYYIQASFMGRNSYRLVDIEGSTLRELKSIIRQAADHNLSTVNIMMHSFSLNRYGHSDQAIVKRLRNILQFIKAQPDVELVTVTELRKYIQENKVKLNGKNFVPYTGYLLTYLRSVEDFERGDKNKIVAVGGIILLCGFPGAVIFLIRFVHKKRTSHPNKEP
jgi:peptidoglycan/xylan/chitin deacetylase (PgdA/CDA1 family)